MRRAARQIGSALEAFAVFRTNKSPLPATIRADTVLGYVGGDVMNSDADSLVKLREEARLWHHAGRQRSQNPSSLVPQIKMIVGDWFTDEFGNQARIIRASD
jgi:hypothetical protein